MDVDIKTQRMVIASQLGRIRQLEAAIRHHRDQRGDDRCWMDDEALYSFLPEGFIPPERDTAVELENCKRFIACRQNPATVYVSPEREIERLRFSLEQHLPAVKPDGVETSDKLAEGEKL